MCRIKAGTKKTIIKKISITPDSIVFFDAMVVLGSTEINQTQEPLRLVGMKWMVSNTGSPLIVTI